MGEILGIFSSIFGGDHKSVLIRELLEQRMRDGGFDELEYRLKVKKLSNVEVMGTPEAAIVTIIDTVMEMQRKGALLHVIFDAIENHRKRLGHDASEFDRILEISRQPGAESGTSVPLYCMYRVNIEHPGIMSSEQLEEAIGTALEGLMNR